MKEIKVNEMIQVIKQNMSTRYIRIIFIMLALFMGAASEAWAYEILSHESGITVYVDKTPSNVGGTIAISSVSNETGGKKVTLTITPPTGYSISENLITAVPVKNISSTRIGTPDLMENPLQITDEGSNKYSFVLPAAYTAAYVTVTFHAGEIGSIVFIRSLDDISSTANEGIVYQLTTDINASGWTSIAEFKGTLDGNFHKITNLSTPLFTTINGGTVKNVILEGVNISSGDNDGDAGAICCKAEGAARIYNCGILPTSVVRNDPEDAKKITGFSGSSVSGSRYVGGLVGFLDGTARVINCFSYANITNGTKVGGIVGYNNQTTTSANGNQKTMVMNCMFYGDITGGSNKAPIYNGTEISNAGDNGVGNYNYFWGGASYVTGTNNIPDIQTYNCALLAETRFLQRFEFFRHLQNSHLQLAEWWVTGTYPKNKSKDELKEMMKWVLEPSQLDVDSKCPFPILKAPGYYPSVVNIDAENAPSTTERNKGGRLGTLSVSIRMGSGGKVYGPPTGATITRSSLTLNITDKDPDHYNFNYYKVQLPYYNDVGTKNYNGYRVVTGWKIVRITGGTPGSFTEGNDATVDANGNITSAPYNFADRHCTNKDLYSVSGRVFNQGAYWDVPEGVTDIIIEPYWANAAYIADEYADVVYDAGMTTVKAVNNIGGGKRYTNGGSWVINGESQKVWKATGSAIGTGEGKINPSSDNTVNDYAIVLVGNVHQYVSTSNSNINSTKKYTVTTIDLDGDNEPDYSFMFRENNRNEIHPLKWDFLNLVGLGMAQKSTGGTGTYNLGILIPTGWFETTNTALFRVTQFEYEHSSRTSTDAIILQGGVMEQWVSYNQRGRSNNIPYIHVGGNVWFKEFHTGCHQDKNQTSGGNQFQPTKHSPISVTGGDYDEFYLTGLYVANSGMNNYADNAECYINGGQFGIVCGAAMEGIGTAGGNDGNIIWQIQNADIKEFYAGGLNAAKPVEGNLTTVIEGGYIKQFCGGPKFGDMNIGKTVKTTAKDCTFDTFYGAGYGGNSYNRYAPSNINNITGDYGTNNWNTFLNNNYKKNYKAGYGVSVTYSTQYLPMSNNNQNVARLLVDYVSFSLAKTRDVTSKLTGCTINKNFYGGGNLGMVDGPVTSTLTDCTVTESVFGAGYSGTLPKVEVRNTGNFVKAPFYNQNLGTYFDPDVPGSEEYTWEQVESVNSSNAIDTNGKKLRTDKDLTTLGIVTGQVTLNIEGTTTVRGCVYGGGAESDVQYKDDDNIKTASTRVNVNGGTISKDVYGGGMGEKTVVANDVEVNIGKAPEGNETAYTGSATINGSVYGGSAFGAVNARSTKSTDGNVTAYAPQDGKTTKVNVLKGIVNGSVFGGGLGQKAGVKTNPDSEEPAPTTDIDAKIYGNATVTIGAAAESADPTIVGSVYGGSNVNGVSEKDVTVTVVRGRITGTGSGATFKDGNVHGGGLGQYTLVKGDVIVNVGVETNDTPAKHYGFATIMGDVYGGSAKGNVNAEWVTDNSTTPAKETLQHVGSTETKVNLYGSQSVRDIYGGGLGELGNNSESEEDDTPANVYGPVTVTVEGGKARYVFGCNNVYGTPKESVTVTINGTAATAVNGTAKTYALQGVYGGGNFAHYDPTTPSTYPTVTVNGCSTSIKDVFGGGNAAAVPYTSVTINGGDIDRVFAGGNGESGTAANVGYKNSDNNPESDSYGTGTTSAIIAGGTINQIFGGSNSKGTVRGSGTLSIEKSTDTGACAMHIGEVYGGGNLAPGAANTITIGCTGSEGEGIEYLYGGANDADVTGDITLNITDGRIQNVFGGNNTGHAISGAITVNINKKANPCGWYIGNVYGGGNKAAYGGESDNKGNSPVVNIKNGTVSGNVYGGGYGSTAIVYGNPQVTIGDAAAGYDADVTGDVYGGGDAAAVVGTPVVHVINKANTSIGNVYGGGNAADVSATSVAIDGGTIGLVFGGGHGDKTTNPQKEANVAGNVSLTVIGGTISKVFGGANSKGSIGGTITLDINKSSATGASAMKIGEVYGGGNEAAGNAGTINIGCTGPLVTGENGHAAHPENIGSTLEGIGAVYGGANQADIGTSSNPSNITLNINSGLVGNVFGGNNTSGTIYGTIEVNIENTNESETCGWYVGNVFGGGNLAQYSGSPAVNIKNGTVSGSVYGAGKGNPDATGTDVGVAGSVTGNPVVTIGDATKTASKAIVSGDVYGGGDAAAVSGNTTVTYNDNNTLSTVGRLFGGGNAAGVSGTSTVTLTSGKVTGGVYGGCNSSGSVGAVTIALNGGQVGANTDENTKADVFGGGLGSSTSTTGNIGITLGTNATTGTTVYGDIYGGSALGSVNASTSNTTTVILTSATLYGNVFGGGKGQNNPSEITATSNGNAIVNINVANPNISGIYGGANIRGNVKGTIAVNINANVGASGTSSSCDIFGGGYGANTTTEGNVTVNIGDNAGTKLPDIYGSIYGGSALGNVNNEATDKTTVNFLNGTLHGNIYGGGLGDAQNAAKVYGQVEVNISNADQTAANCHIDLTAASIYGCNNTNGSPQDNVTVNIYKTAHTSDNGVSGTGYAIDQVFGGGNQADYAPENGLETSLNKATVNIIGCENTIRRVFGGGNAAAALGVVTEIYGGRFDYVYGGGNGEETAANIGAGGTDLEIHGGQINHLFGGSNERGTIAGPMVINVENTCNCGESGETGQYVDEFFCGNNLASIGTSENPANINATIACGTKFGAVYGGCNLAPFYGDINLTIVGGEMDYVYGGSKGAANNAANIYGDVTLTIEGGKIQNVFGGSNVNGNITGSIEVNIEKDETSTCEDGWYVGNVYGASNEAAYTPTKTGHTLKVNIKNGTVSGNVYGGGKGPTATVTSNPVVTIGDVTTGHESYKAIVDGNVYGGGDAAPVVGNTTVAYNDNNADTTVANIYGGGNAASVSGNATVNLSGKATVEGDVFGGGNMGVVGGSAMVNIEE